MAERSLVQSLKKCDPEVAHIIEQQENAQASQLNFIASENVVRPAVLKTLNSVFNDKYAEGYPGKRYYPGCKWADELESLAIKRCKELFKADHANVQPHSGSQANMAVMLSVLEPRDTLLGMSLAAGGHLTHGHAVSFSGQLYKSIQYTVNPATELIEYDAIHELAQTHKPKLIIAGASAYSRMVDFERFRQIADAVGAYLLVDIAHTAGLIIADMYPDPVPYADFLTGTTHKTLQGPRGGFILCKEEHQERIDRAVFPMTQGGPALNTIAGKSVAFYLAQQKDYKIYIKQAVEISIAMARTFEKLGYRIVSGGTDTQLFVVDLTKKNITGRAAEKMLEKVGILVSRSAIPFDQQSPMVSSGIRFGTLAFTARGFTLEHIKEVVSLIDKLLSNPNNAHILKETIQQVTSITNQAHLPPC